MKKSTLLFCILSILAPSYAIADASKNLITAAEPACSGTTCITGLGTDASRSFTLDNTIMKGGKDAAGFGLLLVWVALTDANNSVTGVSLSCTASHDANVIDYRIPACVWDSANTRYNCEAGPLFWNPSDEIAADTKYQIFRYDIEGIEDVECTLAFTNGAAGDTVTVKRSWAVKG